MLYKFLHSLYNAYAYEKKTAFSFFHTLDEFRFLTVLVSLSTCVRAYACALLLSISFHFFSLAVVVIAAAAMSKSNVHTDAIRFVDRAFTQHHICTVLRKIKSVRV